MGERKAETGGREKEIWRGKKEIPRRNEKDAKPRKIAIQLMHYLYTLQNVTFPNNQFIIFFY